MEKYTGRIKEIIEKNWEHVKHIFENDYFKEQREKYLEALPLISRFFEMKILWETKGIKKNIDKFLIELESLNDKLQLLKELRKKEIMKEFTKEEMIEFVMKYNKFNKMIQELLGYPGYPLYEFESFINEIDITYEELKEELKISIYNYVKDDDYFIKIPLNLFDNEYLDKERIKFQANRKYLSMEEFVKELSRDEIE